MDEDDIMDVGQEENVERRPGDEDNTEAPEFAAPSAEEVLPVAVGLGQESMMIYEDYEREIDPPVYRGGVDDRERRNDAGREADDGGRGGSHHQQYEGEIPVSWIEWMPYFKQIAGVFFAVLVVHVLCLKIYDVFVPDISLYDPTILAATPSTIETTSTFMVDNTTTGTINISNQSMMMMNATTAEESAKILESLQQLELTLQQTIQQVQSKTNEIQQLRDEVKQTREQMQQLIHSSVADSLLSDPEKPVGFEVWGQPFRWTTLTIARDSNDIDVNINNSEELSSLLLERPQWDDFLHLIQLSDLDSEEYESDSFLRQAFQNAQNNLDTVIQNPSQVDWFYINQLLRQVHQSRRQPQQQHHDGSITVEGSCPRGIQLMEEVQVATQEDLDDRLIWYQEQLQQYLIQLQQGGLFKNEKNIDEEMEINRDDNDNNTMDLLVVDANMQQRIMQAIKESIMEWKRKKLDPLVMIRNNNKDNEEDEGLNSSNNNICIKSQQVLPWIDAGLDAIYHRLDVRDALYHAMEIDGFDISNIILDVDLTSDSKTRLWMNTTIATSSSSVPNYINLRQLLDSPFVSHQLPQWVNQMIDMISGYHDSIDVYLDEKMKRLDDVGITTVQELLKIAETILIPLPSIVHTTRAGLLRP